MTQALDRYYNKQNRPRTAKTAKGVNLMFKNWTFDDWMNHILFVLTIFVVIYSFL